MKAQTQSSGAGLKKNKSPSDSKNYGWYTFLLVVTALLIAGYLFSTLKLYKSGDHLGRNMGWVGLFMMLTLALYPLRKRFSFMMKLGGLPKWFKWHMIFGILGPALILFHATFHIGSVNGGVALLSMILVSSSGIFGRFFYTKIHHGLYGKQASLKEIQAGKEQVGDVKSLISFAPQIQQSLERFSARAVNSSKATQIRIWDSLTIGIQAEWLFWSLARDLKRSLYASPAEAAGDVLQAQDVDASYQEYKKFIRAYLRAIRDVAQFRTYEKLFSLWHIFHIPLVFILVLSAIFHILGVYMF